MKKTLLAYLFILNLFGGHLASQETKQELDFNQIKDGISQVGVHTITQDNNGFIWIGTHGSGIYRYDGMNYVSYRPKVPYDERLNSSFVYCTYIDNNNRLWVGTNIGLALYDGERDEFRHIPLISKTNQNLGNVGITSLQGDKNGNLYIGTNQQGVFLIDLNDLRIEKIPFTDSGQDSFLAINDIKITDQGVLYAASSSGLLEIDPKSKKADLALFRSGKDAVTITPALQSLLIDSNNTIWVGSIYNGVYKIKLADIKTEPLVENFNISSNSIFSLIESPYGGLLCGTENDGLYHLNESGVILHHYLFDKNDENSILSNSIWSLYKDTDDRVWMGFYNRGVVVHDKFFNKFNRIQSIYNKPNSLQTSSVTSIASDNKNNLWIAMDGGGIDVLDQSTNEFTHINTESNSKYTGLTSDYIQTLFIDSHQNLWAGSWDKGLFILKNGSTKFINYKLPILIDRKGSSAVMSFAEDSNGRIWIGSFNQGLYSYQLSDKSFNNLDSSSFQSHNLVGNYINKIVIDDNDVTWVSTTNELIKLEYYNEQNDSPVSMNNFLVSDNGNTSNYYAFDIVSLFAGENHNLWLGTRGLGLVKFNTSDNTAIWYDEKNGLNMPNINGIIKDSNGNLWLDGTSGITMFDTEQKEFTSYSKNDGLISSAYNKNAVYKDNDGKLYFGGTEGVDYFDPSHIELLKTPPNIYLKNFKIFNEEIKPAEEKSPLTKVLSQTDSITLTSKQSVFTIEYAGINFTRSEENQYAYYLDGYEEDWNYVGEARSATYTNLDAGHYIFKVKAANNDGVWSETPEMLHIDILPPWWQTNWAMLLYFLVVVALLSLLRRFEKKRILDKQQVENERQKRIREEELHKERIQFFTNVAHEFSSPLTLILNPIKDILSEKGDDYSNRLKLKHLTIYKNTERLIRLINELLDFSKLESDKIKIHASRLNIVSFIREVINHFKEEALSNHIELEVNTEEEVIWIWADEGMLEKIVFNLLSNAFKITPDGGKILVAIKQVNNGIRFEVTDTGPGLKDGEIENLFQRFYQGEPLKKGYYSGTGIGLELVNSFVKLHKGSVDVESDFGHGSTFSVVLPSGNNHLKASQIITTNGKISSLRANLIKPELTEESTFSSKPERKAKTLLIVEDDTELRNYLKNEFKNEFKVVVSKNGSDGLRLAQEMLPDVIITDVVMPEMNGYDFCEAIRTNIKTSHIPIMMLTAKSKMDNRISGIEKGADVYLVKPFDMKLVRHHLSQLIYSREVIYKKYFKSMGEIQSDINITSLDKAFIEKAINYTHENMTSPGLGVESLASHLNLSRSQLYRKMKALTNQTANEFIRNQRLQQAKILIENGNTDLNNISSLVGFSSTSYFTQRFKDYYGVSPTEIKHDNV